MGPPLPPPEHELPAYGRALLLSAAGALLALSFAAGVAAALLRRETLALGSDALLRAAHEAAWRLKWTALPLSLVAAGVGLKLYAGMRRRPARFAGRRVAAAGLALTLCVAVALAALVGVSLPERLRRRELARRAEARLLLYSADEALARYRARFGTLPASLSDLRRLDDPDCSISNLLVALGDGDYRPEADLASAAVGRKGRVRRRPARARTVNAGGTDDLAAPGLALTNYELTLPGRDQLFGTEDDLRVRDGRVLEGPRGGESDGRRP